MSSGCTRTHAQTPVAMGLRAVGRGAAPTAGTVRGCAFPPLRGSLMPSESALAVRARGRGAVRARSPSAALRDAGGQRSDGRPVSYSGDPCSHRNLAVGPWLYQGHRLPCVDVGQSSAPGCLRAPRALLQDRRVVGLTALSCAAGECWREGTLVTCAWPWHAAVVCIPPSLCSREVVWCSVQNQASMETGAQRRVLFFPLQLKLRFPSLQALTLHW